MNVLIGLLFSKTTKTMEKVIINVNNIAEYNKLKSQGGIVLWVGEGKICFEVKTLYPFVGAGLVSI